MDYVLSGKAVRRLIPIVRGVSGGAGTTYPQAAVSPDAFPPPYTVRWSAAANSKAGAWVIWLGDRSRVLYHNGVSQQPTGVVPVGELPTGWFRIRTVSASSTTVWLNVRTDSSTGAFGDAILSESPESATTGSDVASYCVATMAHDSTTGSRTVKQYIDSAVTLGAGASGTPTGTVEFVADCDWYVDGSVHQLRKRLRILDLATGQVTDKPGTTYANGWEVMADTTPISGIIN